MSPVTETLARVVCASRALPVGAGRLFHALFRTDFITMIGRIPNLPAKHSIPIRAFIYGRLDRDTDMPEDLRNKVAPSEG